MRGRTRFPQPKSKTEAVFQCLFFTFGFWVLGVATGGILLVLLPLPWVLLVSELRRLSKWPGNVADQTFVGPRGGRYRINSKGNKVYDR